MTQLSLMEQAREDRDEALRRVDEAADVDWKDLAYEAVKRTAELLPELISDDVWELSELSDTRENRALGAVFRRAARDGLIRKTDRVKPSVRSHLSGKPVWVSQIYRGRQS